MKPADGRALVAARVSADTLARLDLFIDLLVRWQARLNLVAPSTMAQVWTRHVLDSLQVSSVLPEARVWADFGSGGGFPGLVTAIVLADQTDACVHLVESDKRKAAFLAAVSRETGAPAQVHPVRIEDFASNSPSRVDAVSARALAPLPMLVRYAAPFLLDGATGVFPKGQGVESELTAIQRDHRFHVDSIPSTVQEGSHLVIVRAASRAGEC